MCECLLPTDIADIIGADLHRAVHSGDANAIERAWLVLVWEQLAQDERLAA